MIKVRASLHEQIDASIYAYLEVTRGEPVVYIPATTDSLEYMQLAGIVLTGKPLLQGIDVYSQDLIGTTSGVIIVEAVAMGTPDGPMLCWPMKNWYVIPNSSTQLFGR